MLTEATIQRIGGSTFARLSPDVVKALGLNVGDKVQLNILKHGITLGEFQRLADENPLSPEWKAKLKGWKKDVKFSKYD
jgi:antitoxin component of MazEF toxin-antitoxin module